MMISKYDVCVRVYVVCFFVVSCLFMQKKHEKKTSMLEALLAFEIKHQR